MQDAMKPSCMAIIDNNSKHALRSTLSTATVIRIHDDFVILPSLLLENTFLTNRKTNNISHTYALSNTILLKKIYQNQRLNLIFPARNRHV